MFGTYQEFERRVGLITTSRDAKREMILDTINRLPHHFQIGDIERVCAGVSRPTINRALKELRNQGKITRIKSGRDAMWEKT